MDVIQYEQSSKYWAGEGLIIIQDSFDQELITVPVEFMLKGGQTTYSYVYEQLRSTFEEEGTLHDSDKVPIDLNARVKAGLLFIISGRGKFREQA